MVAHSHWVATTPRTLSFGSTDSGIVTTPITVASSADFSCSNSTFTYFEPPSQREFRMSSVLSIDEDGRSFFFRGNNDFDDVILEFYNRQQLQHLGFTPIPIAGNATFFHSDIYGSLRKGAVNATLFSRQYAGYVLSAFVSGYMYAAIEFVLLRLPPEVLGLGLKNTRAIQDLLNMQWAVVLLLGLISDAYAPFGYRRSAYIICGWLLMGLVWTALSLLFQFSDQIFGSPMPPPAVAITGVTSAILALAITTNALDIRVIELSQQEELRTRGRLVATYQSVRVSTQVALHTLVLAMTSPTTSILPAPRSLVGTLTFSSLALPFPVQLFFMHLALVALLSIPLFVKFASEERLSSESAAPHLLETCKQFCRCAQQKAIWQLIAFNCVLYFFALLDFTEVSKAIEFWTHEASPESRLVRSVVCDAVFVVALLLWKYYGVNANWIATTTSVLVSWSLVYFMGNTLVAFDVARSPWIVTIMSVLRVGLRVLLLLSAFVPTIEVAQQGSEGTIYGLLSSFQSIAKVLGAQLITALRDSGGLRIRVEDLTINSSSIQRTVFWGILAMTGVKLLSLTALWFCPQQKLDAQQLRIYGGYSRRALLAIIVVFAVSFPLATYFQFRWLSLEDVGLEGYNLRGRG